MKFLGLSKDIAHGTGILVRRANGRELLKIRKGEADL
jgi:hypothetical protein